ncbi:CHAT domain-containing tetratricopeptide repeat protein [Catenuloplanes japonicus]|uniref:CHAT domain-containing tetratricopeptide repeat protein n=1 Tax=Catenuloplanes japonicus TaxID=33876 RepID=UPI0005266690|nr:CHAT domain-containing protein [Catenuloplanes japonicus]
MASDGFTAVVRAHRDGDAAALVRAVQELALSTDLGSVPADRAAEVGNAFYLLAEQTDDPEPLRGAERAYRAALAGGDHGEAARWRTHLGMCLVRQSERIGRAAALDEAVPLLRAAAAELPGDLAAHANLGLGLMRLMERTGEAALLPEILGALSAAGDAAVRRPSARAKILSNTSSALMAAWELTGLREHLDGAVDAGRAACALVPAGDPAVPGCAAALARALLDRSTVTGDRSAAAEASRRLRRSLRAVPAGDPDRPIYLNQLGIAGRLTFAGTGDLAALDEAIRDWGEAVRLLPDGHPDRLAFRANRAGALRNRFETVADVGALDEAVRELEEVVAATEAGDPERAARLAGLANALHRRGDPVSLHRAAELLRAAAGLVPPDRPEHRAHRTNLGSVLLTGARLATAANGIDEAIEVLSDATAGVGPDDPELADTLLNLGDARALRDGPGDREQAAEAYTRLAGTTVAPALTRAMAAQGLGRLRARAGDWASARDALGQAVGLLDLVAWAGLGRDDQERLLSQFPALATTAAACALELGDADDAVEILEQGRGVLYAQALTRWADTGTVRADLAERLGAAHDLIEARPAVWERHRAVRERDAVLDEIRRTPGLEHFLRPPRIGDLRAGLGDSDSTVVIINVAAHRCDALLMTGDTTGHVPLPDLHSTDITRYAAAAIRPTDAGLTEALGWLWDTVAGPVLERVAPTGHVRWMPTGALSFLPIHAAGDALDRVVSSYAPTLRSVASVGTPSATRLAAVVAPGDTSRLPASLQEAAEVIGRLGAGASLLAGADATTSRVRDLLADVDWLHFAGHAEAFPARPSDSHLALHDGLLQVRDILRHRATARTLAYLSACATVQGGARLPDENIHVASALQLAGFAHVIATYWPVPDAVAKRAARLIYDGLRGGRPAHAVNAASRALRDRYPGQPTQWAAYVHVGPDAEVTLPIG